MVQISTTWYARHGKRIVDVIIAAGALVIFSPVMLTAYLLLRRDIGTPVLFRQKRIGKGGKIFVMYKFRNMTNETDENGILLPPEQRVTELGKKIRAASIDELPQLINILKGDMSILGPRPLLPNYLERYTEHDAYRHAIRPGLECPSLKDYDHEITWEEQFENDVWYVENVSFLLDVKLFIRLIQMVFNPKKSRAQNNRGSYREEEFGPIHDFRDLNL